MILKDALHDFFSKFLTLIVEMYTYKRRLLALLKTVKLDYFLELIFSTSR